MKEIEQQIATSVLVIGTGGAGLRAAIELAERGVDVLAVGKRPKAKSSGLVSRAGRLASPAIADNAVSATRMNAPYTSRLSIAERVLARWQPTWQHGNKQPATTGSGCRATTPGV